MTKEIKEQSVQPTNTSDKSVTRKRMDRSELKRFLRNPLNLSSVLGVDLDHTQFVYRWAIQNSPDRAGRIDQLQAMGYEIVHDTKKVGDNRSENASITGSAVRAHGGGGLELILMRIPKELHKEIQDLKQEIVDEASLGTLSHGQSKVGAETKIRGQTIN